MITDERGLIPAIGTIAPAARMFRANWVTALRRSPSGVPLLPPRFVAQQGPSVRIIDVREADELVGALGHIAGSSWIPRHRVSSLASRVSADDPIVLVSRGGERAAELARALEDAGLRFVAALEGGVIAWRDQGFRTTREQALLERMDVLSSPPAETPRSQRQLALTEVRTHLGEERNVRWLKLAAMLVHGRLACVDGRDESGVIGTPGGDAGELALALTALEQLTGTQLGADAVLEILKLRLDWFGHFYFHTDVHAGNQNIAALRADRRFDAALANVSESLHWRRFFTSPPAELTEPLLEHTLVPAHVGCGHLRRSLLDPEAYGTRRALVESVISGFFRLRWSGASDAEAVVLAGDHAEGGVLLVELEGGVFPFSWVPLISPAVAGAQLFVSHPQVTAWLRRQFAELLATRATSCISRGVSADALEAAMTELGARQLTQTLRGLALGLPIYVARYGADGAATVEHTGFVE